MLLCLAPQRSLMPASSCMTSHWAHGVMVSHPLSTREALGSIPSVSTVANCFGWAGVLVLQLTIASYPLLGRFSRVAGRLASFLQIFKGPCGLMDKALVFGTKDCRFESCQGHPLCLAGRNPVAFHGYTAMDAPSLDMPSDGSLDPQKTPFHQQHSGVAQWLACWAHNPKVRGSKPRSATHCFVAECMLAVASIAP